MFGELLYWYLGCRQDFATVLFFEQGLCERECTVLGQRGFSCFVYSWAVINRDRYRITLAGING